MSTLGILACVIGVVLFVLLLALGIWWLRTQSGAAIRSFYAAVRQMEHEQGIQDRYQSPWFLMLGEETRNAQLCSSWNLLPTDKPAWFGRWWADPEGAVLVVPETLFLPDEGMKSLKGGWWRLLGLFLRLRARRPLDGVIWNISASRLQDEDRTATLGLVARRRFTDLLQRLGLSLPVYVVVTGMEEIPGFQELIAALPPDAHQQALGWSSPYAPEAIWQSHWSDTALDQVTQALSEAIIEIGALSGQLSEELYCLPDRFQALRRNLQLLLEPVFQGNAQGESPRLRGLYFTASQASAVDDEMFSASDTPLLGSVFSRQLWQRRIIAEQGLAQPVPRLLRLRQRWQRVAAFGALIVGVLWAIAMLWVWQDSVKDAHELARLLQGEQKDYVAVNDETHRTELTRHNVQGFWQVLEKAPRWHFSALVFPTSWFSGLNTQMNVVLQRTALTHLQQPLNDLLLAEMKTLSAIRNTERRSTLEGEDPARWQDYAKAKELVERAVNLEQRNQLFSQSLSNKKNPLDDLVLLSNGALGLNLNVGTLYRAPFYNRVLADNVPLNLKPLDLSAEHKAVAEHFSDLMDRWLTQYFLADNFVRPAGYLKLHLERLEAGSENTLVELEDLNALIDDLQATVDLTNSAWGRGKGHDLVPGYRDLLDKVRQSSLLGPPLEQEVNAQAEQLQQRFRDQWISRGGSRNNLLVQQGSGQLELQEHISHLHNAIVALFKRDFVAVALRKDPSESAFSTQNVDNDGLNTALSYYASYKSYMNDELPRIPPAYRGAMVQAAENAAADAMWLSLKTRTAQAQTYNVSAFDIQTEQALALHKAFNDLKRSDLATSLQNYLNRGAVADISTALDEINEQPVFRERVDISQWDGSKNLGLQLFRATDVQDLKLGLNQQFAVMQNITEQHTPALEWLRSQQQNLSAADNEKVVRLGSLSEEMIKYKAQNPSSAPALITQLLSRDFVEMDASTCATILQSANLSTGRGELAQRGLALQQGAMRRCQVLQQQQAASAWNDLADYFNQYLADRFPFSYDLQAADADPARVQHLLELIDNRLPQAQDGLKLARSSERLAAADFLNRLKQARGWLGSLFLRDKAGVVGVDMDVRWRTDRESERGADQVIDWRLSAGNQQINYPGDEQQRLRWTVGQSVKLALRWAKNGTQRPVNDPQQPDLGVADLQAEWEYTGPWSLLRLMRSHVSTQRQPNSDYTDFPLTLEVPVHALADEENQTMMFLRLSLMTQGAKLPLSIQPLPVRAPRTPFAFVPGSMASAEGPL